MGAWGVGIFEDDSTLDWLEEDYASAGADAVRSVLSETAAVRDDGYLEAPEGGQTRVAAEIVAAANGAAADGLSAEQLSVLQEHASGMKGDGELIELALKAVARLTEENSELAELWGGEQAWAAAISGLADRLKGAL